MAEMPQMLGGHGNSMLRNLARPSNLLSLSRIPLGLVAWLAPSNVEFIMTLLFVAGLTDWLDGWVARRAHIPAENMGAWLDPLCDKIFVGSILAAIWIQYEVPLWIGLVALLREFVLLPLFVAKVLWPSLRRRTFRFRAKVLGKVTTVIQFSLFVVILLQHNDCVIPLAVLAGIAGVAAGVDYTLRALRASIDTR